VVQYGHILKYGKDRLMTVTAPVRDVKDTAAFVDLVEREGEVIVTRNGYDVMHCISSAQHRINEEAIAKGRLLSRMMLAEDQISSGDVADFDSFAAQIRGRYGL
jgi:hypothetical protein